MERLIGIHVRSQRESSDRALANSILDEAVRLDDRERNHTRHLEQACEFGLLHYVQHSLSILPSLARSQIAADIFPYALIPNPISTELCPDLVAYLLGLGVDVNQLRKRKKGSDPGE